jgi:hypothetical protein
MNKVSTNQSEQIKTKKGLNIKKVGAIVVVALVLGASTYGLGFTTKGQTVVRVIVEPAPAVNAYAAQDAVVEEAKAEFNSQIASPKAN